MSYTEVDPEYTYIPSGPVEFGEIYQSRGLRRRSAYVPAQDAEGTEHWHSINFIVRQSNGRSEKPPLYWVGYSLTELEDGKPKRTSPRSEKTTVSLLRGLDMWQVRAFLEAITPCIVKANVWGEILWNEDALHEAVVAFSKQYGVDCSGLYRNESRHKYEEAMRNE